MIYPVISIIAPVYRTPADLLLRFLKSALNQTLSDIELIAVNDASPDHCPRILNETAASDARMHVVHRDINGRAGMARNDGLNLARGKYVLFADADDFLRPDMCEMLAGIADRRGADIVKASFTASDPAGRFVFRRRLPDRVLNLKLPFFRATAYHDFTLALWDKLFRRSVIAPLRFEQYEANIGEDTLFNVAALCRSRKMVMTSYAGYDYTVHPTSATGRAVKGIAYLRTIVDSGKRIRQVLGQNNGSQVEKKFADLLDLKRFAIGCGWIAENPDTVKKDELWQYWRQYFKKELYPLIHSRKVLAAWALGVLDWSSPRRACQLIWWSCRFAEPVHRIRRLKDTVN